MCTLVVYLIIKGALIKIIVTEGFRTSDDFSLENTMSHSRDITVLLNEIWLKWNNMQEKESIMCYWFSCKNPSLGLPAARNYAALRPRDRFSHPHQEHMIDSFSCIFSFKSYFINSILHFT